MSVVIRLRKPGKTVKKHYHYKVVVDEKRSKKDGKFIESLGYWDPSQQPKRLKIDLEKYKKWLSLGAKPSKTVKDLVKKAKENKDSDLLRDEKPRKKKKTAVPPEPEKAQKENEDKASEPAKQEEPESNEPDADKTETDNKEPVSE
jgi:small subunit ribosomal protein S16